MFSQASAEAFRSHSSIVIPESIELTSYGRTILCTPILYCSYEVEEIAASQVSCLQPQLLEF